MALRVGGQCCNIAMKSMIHGCLDVTNKLSCHLVLKQKGWRWGESWKHRCTKAAKITSQMPVLFSVGPAEKHPIFTYASTLLISLSAPKTLPLQSSPHFLPETFCQMLPDSHICAENELYPRALWVKDSLVKNTVLLDEQTNVPCNVVALAFYATLKESINLHNSNKHVLPLWRHG